MVKYELVVALESNRSEDEINASLAKIEDLITRHGATIDTKETWGKRKLAYQINRRREAHYTLIHFDAEPTSQVLPELARYLRITEDVLRHLVTRAVIGKSRGTPPAPGEESQYDSRPPYRGGGRGFGGGPRGGDRGGERYERRPDREGAPAAAAPAPAVAQDAAPAPAAAPAPSES